jgi:hypothetical protein
VPLSQDERSSVRVVGSRLPPVELPFVAEEGTVSLARLAKRHRLLICIYSSLGCGEELRRLISWSHHAPDLEQYHRYRPIAISSESFAQQLLWASLLPGWMILSDTELLLARSLDLPTINDDRGWRYAPMALITQGDRVAEASCADPDETARHFARVAREIGR